MANLAQKVVQRSKFPAISLDDYVSFFGFGGLNYPFGFTQTLSGTKEEIADYSFEGLVLAGYKTNGVVFACMLARQLLFSEARFQYRQRLNGRPGDLFGTKDLQILERPWPGGVTADLLSRAIQDVDLSGNFFATRRPNRIRRMRPDWVTIILGSLDDPTIEAGDLDAEVVGYMYHPGGRLSARPPVMLLREQVAHFAPIPDPTASYRGMSWLIPVIREFISDTAMITHKQKFFENGATPNMVVTLDPSIKKEAFKEWVQMFSDKHEGALNAYKTLYLGAGSTVMPVGKDFRQMDFAITQAAGETRIAAAAGVPPVIVGLSEGLKAATYSNYSQARRRFADMTMRPLWRSMATSLEILVPSQPNAELWYDDRDIPALIEDFKDRAEVQARNAQAIRQLVDAGFEPDAVVDAITADDLKRLAGKHTGLFSVQLQPPQPNSPAPDGSPGTPDNPAHAGALDSTGPSASKTGAGDPKPAPAPAAEKKSAAELLMEIAELRHLVVGPPQLPARAGDVNVHLHEGMVRSDPHIEVDARTTVEDGAIRVEPADVHVEAPTTIADGAIRVDAPTTIAEGAVRVRTPDVHVEAPTTIQEGAVRVEAPTTFAEGSIRGGDVTVEPADVEVRIEPGAVRVDAPTTIEAGAVQVDVAPAELRMEAGAVQVDAPTTIEAGAVQVESPVTVERTEVHVDPGAVQVSSPVTVERTEVHVDKGAVQIDAPVTVERTEVHVDEGAVRVDAPVTVERTEVHLDPGSVTVPVTVERTEVHIDPGAVQVEANTTIEDGAVRMEAPISVTTPEVRVDQPITVHPADVRFEEGAIRVEAPTTIAEGAVRLDAPITMERGAVEVQVDSPVHIEDGAVRVESPVTVEPGTVEVNSPITVEAPKVPERKKRGATVRDTTFRHDGDGKIVGKREIEIDDEGQRMVRDTEFITDDDGKIVGKREVEGETDD